MYHALQDPRDAASPEELAAMDRALHDLREAIATAKVNEKILKAKLVTVNASMSPEDIRAGIITLESEKREMQARLGALMTGSVKPVSLGEKEEVDKAWKEWSRKAKVRKSLCMDLWAFCTEEMQDGQTKEDLWVWCSSCTLGSFMLMWWFLG